ncbi:MAG TPA: hypothetical protein VMG12_11360 [Polyangiaceae bacterium]|nr:hypothetical protein [Polyangiaceae bacterium]
MRRCWTLVMVSSLVVACGVESQGESSGGLYLEDSAGPVRGFAVVGGDFSSTTISLLGVDGQVQSSSFISSASTDPGLSAALGGDVVLPSTTQRGGELVLLDRLPGSVLTWVAIETAEVRAQLSVATGFSSNPHDYVPFSPTQAFVPRFEPNLMGGAEPFDGGNDVLVVNPATLTIDDRIDLMPALAGEAAGFYPRAERALMAGGKLRVLAVGLNADFTDSADSRLITIDPMTHAIDSVLVLAGLKACSSLRPSPDGSALAIACNGAFGTDPALGFPDSGVVLVDVADEPVESARFTADTLGVGPINQAAWLDDTHLALLTFGRFSADGTLAEADDEARTLDLDAGAASEPWLTTGPFSLGDVACALDAGACLVADAETDGGVVHTLVVGAAGEVMLTGSVKPDVATGLPPRSLGTF